MYHVILYFYPKDYKYKYIYLYVCIIIFDNITKIYMSFKVIDSSMGFFPL